MTLYCSAADLTSPIRLGGRSDNSLAALSSMLTAASRWIDKYFGLDADAFAQSGTDTRYFDAGSQRGSVLRLDMPLLELTSITNGDSSPVDINDVILTPRNTVPAMTLRINSGAWVASYSDAIAVTGKWGYSTEVPDVIREATAILAVWMFNEFQTRRTVDGRSFESEGDDIRTDNVPALLTTLLSPIAADLKRMRHP